MVARTVFKNIVSIRKVEGVGAVIYRSIGVRQMRNFSPFLLLDDFSVHPKNTGFPPHPHHGMETITYLRTGSIAHEDFSGGKGILNEGDLQFMTAGIGIMHAEIPLASSIDEEVTGIQLWVDLPQKLKNINPRYRDLRKSEIPVVNPDNKIQVKVINGNSYGVCLRKSLAYTDVNYYHFLVSPGGYFKQEMPQDYNVFLHIINGNILMNGKTYEAKSTIFFNRDGNLIEGGNSQDSEKNLEFILVGGQIQDQEIVQNGPFVETSKEKIKNVYDDYLAKENGFLRAKNYKFHLKVGTTKEEAIKFVNNHNSE